VALQESERKLLFALEGAHLGVWERDPVTNVRRFDTIACRIYGIKATTSTVTDEEFYAIVHPDDREMLGQALTHAAEGGELHLMRYRVIWPDNSVHWILTHGDQVCDESGSLIRWQGVIEDITERKLAEETLRRSEENLNLSVGRVGTWNWDLVGDVLEWSPRAKAMFGLGEATEVTHASFLAALHPEDRDAADAAIKSALAGKTDCDMEYRAVWPDGTVRWIYDLGRAYEDASGTPVRMAGSMLDITERKLAEEILLETNERLEGILKSITTTMGRVVEVRDPYTQGHQIAVARIARLIAEEMGLPEDDVEGIEIAALVHDIGKLSVPAEILTKPRKLSDIEFALIKEHAQTGYEILKDIDFDWPVAEVVWQHHERMDGSGYPQGLKGEDISMPARILAVADVIEAMVSHRPYRAALGLEAAIEEITNNPDKFDPQVTAACVRLQEEGRLGLRTATR
jgi:PAS domain S-box-containing protein/putative nucleotidyltransferase with HDIG domain